MMIKWLGLVQKNAETEIAPRPGTVGATEASSVDGVDVAHKVLAEEAQRRHRELEGLVKFGWPIVQREKMKKRVRRKVWEVVASAFRQPDDDMVEEITERIVEVAEIDPTYEKMFPSDRDENE